MKKKTIILLGGGGHCKSCIDIIELAGDFEVVGILDLPHKVGMNVLDKKIIGTDDDIPQLSKNIVHYFVTVGQIKTPDKRIKLFNLLAKNNHIEIPIIISPFAHVSKYAKVGIGTIVMHNAIISSNSFVGENCIINTNSLIEHDSVIENHCHISTGAIVNGTVTVGMGTFIGSGAVTNNNCNIPQRSFIKANSFFGG